MIKKLYPLIQLLVIYLSLLIAGLISINYFSPEISVKTYVTLLTLMTVISLGAYFLFFLGSRKPGSERGLYLLAALGGKFLAYLIIILLFWVNGKNLTKDFIIVFFVLYLMLTFFLVRIIIKTIKTN